MNKNNVSVSIIFVTVVCFYLVWKREVPNSHVAKVKLEPEPVNRCSQTQLYQDLAAERWLGFSCDKVVSGLNIGKKVSKAKPSWTDKELKETLDGSCRSFLASRKYLTVAPTEEEESFPIGLLSTTLLKLEYTV